MVLAGGYATRLRPISYALPKFLFPVVGRAMTYWTLDLLKAVGTEEVVLGVNYLAEALRAKVGSEYGGMKITYSNETQELGTAGPIKLAATCTQMNETFIALNGDVIAQINLKEMLRQHSESKAIITDALHEVKSPRGFGVVQLGKGNRIKRFVEKPAPGKEPSHLVNAGIYIIEPGVLDMIPSGRKVSLEREIFPKLATHGELFGFSFSGHWFDIGNLTDYRRANFSLLRDSARKSEVQAGGSVAADATIRWPVYLGENSNVKSKARAGPNALLGNNSSIGERGKVAHSILFDNVSIGEGADVKGAIIATGVRIGKGVRVGRGCVISSNVTVADRIRIGDGAIIHPHKEVIRNVRPNAHVM